MARLTQLTLVLAPVLALAAPGPLRAELRPDEVAIVAVRGSRESRELAAFYAETRGVPADNVCLIDVPPHRDLSRVAWESDVRPVIRAWVEEHDPEGELRCLVTTWDVPLKIGRAPLEGTGWEKWQKFAAEKRAEQVARLAAIVEEVDGLGGGLGNGNREFPSKGSAKDLQKSVQSTFEAAQKRLRAMPNAEARSKDLATLQQLVVEAAGLRSVMSQPRATGEAARKAEAIRGRVVGLSEGLAALERLPESLLRDRQILKLVNTRDGLVGGIRWLENWGELLEKNESYSSLDSELSLLFWDGYPLVRWQPNLLHHRFDDSPLREERRTLMVARLEAPTLERTYDLVRTSVEIEKQGGPAGKFYVDARGLAAPKPGGGRGSYGEYDEALRQLAKLVERHRSDDREVVLDDEQALFGEGDAPDAGLYCGWYSLSKYVDAFDWEPGAVAYHIASGEAATLRNPGSQVWCKRMLEEGVCATLGPVHEPYLAAFPKPDEFFVLLLSGRCTLAETYYRTKPYNSWVMTLVGDPLYNPFGTEPGLESDELPEAMRQVLPPAED